MSNNVVLLVGAGSMAREYAKVLKAQSVPFVVVSRGEEKAQLFKAETGVVDVVTGGIGAYHQKYETETHKTAIIAVNIDQLASVTLQVLELGVKRIFLEKPGAVSRQEFTSLKKAAERSGATVYLAYNRRFYSSVRAAERIIEADGGVRSFHFEFTEWRHIFDQRKNKAGLERLFLGNSSHVVDMAFFLAGGQAGHAKQAGHVGQAGRVEKIDSIVRGEGEIEWHPCGSIFAGHGEMTNGAVFSYNSDWNAPGRWSVYVNTEKHKLIFMPLEKLKIQDKGSVQIKDVELEDEKVDIDFKPGFFKEVEAFLTGSDKEREKLCTFDEQIDRLDLFAKISGENY